MLAANVSIAAVWVQDWAGAYEQDIFGMQQMRLRWNWRLDRKLYPDWEGLLTNLSARGVRMMTYVNPFLQVRHFKQPAGRDRDRVCDLF